jgi:hypothetical protein
MRTSSACNTEHTACVSSSSLRAPCRTSDTGWDRRVMRTTPRDSKCCNARTDPRAASYTAKSSTACGAAGTREQRNGACNRRGSRSLSSLSLPSLGHRNDTASGRRAARTTRRDSTHCCRTRTRPRAAAHTTARNTSPCAICTRDVCPCSTHCNSTTGSQE